MILTTKWKLECSTAGIFHFLQYVVEIILLDKNNTA